MNFNNYINQLRSGVKTTVETLKEAKEKPTETASKFQTYVQSLKPVTPQVTKPIMQIAEEKQLAQPTPLFSVSPQQMGSVKLSSLLGKPQYTGGEIKTASPEQQKELVYRSTYGEPEDIKQVTPYNFPEYLQAKFKPVAAATEVTELGAKTAGSWMSGDISTIALDYLDARTPEKKYPILYNALPSAKIPEIIPYLGGMDWRDMAFTLPEHAGLVKGGIAVEKAIYGTKLGGALSKTLGQKITEIKNPVLRILAKATTFLGAQAAFDYPSGFIMKPNEEFYEGKPKETRTLIDELNARQETAKQNVVIGMMMATAFKGAGAGIKGTTKLSKIGIQEAKQIYADLKTGSNFGQNLINDLKLTGQDNIQPDFFENIKNSDLTPTQKIGAFSQLKGGFFEVSPTTQLKMKPSVKLSDLVAEQRRTQLSIMGDEMQKRGLTSQKAIDTGMTPKQMEEARMPIEDGLIQEAKKAIQEGKSADEFVKTQTIYRGQPENFKFRRAIADVNASDNILIGKGVFSTSKPEMAGAYGTNILKFKKPTEKILDISNASVDDLKKLRVDKNTIKVYQNTLKNTLPATIFNQIVEFDGRKYKIFRKVNIGGEIMYELQPTKYGEKEIYKSISEIENIVKPKQNLSNVKDAEDILMNNIIERFTGGKSVEELINGGASEAGKLKSAKEAASKWLNKQGYDFVKHQGGIRAGGGKELHDVYIALSDEALKPQSKSQLLDIYNKAKSESPYITEPKPTPELRAGQKPLTTGEINERARREHEALQPRFEEKPINLLPIKREVNSLKNKIKETALVRGIGKLLTPISTRLGNIAPILKPAIRRLDYDIGTSILKDTKGVLPFLEKQKKLSKEDKILFDRAKNNSDKAVINELAKKYGLENELAQTRAVLDDIYKRGNEVGMEVNYKGDYFPRMITDAKGLMDYLYGTDGWSAIEKAIKGKAIQLGIKVEDLTIEEKAGIVNSLLRGYGNKITLSIPGQAKQRQIEFLTKDLEKFYAKPDVALTSYITVMNEEIAARKFFGKELNTNPKNLNAADSIGAYVMQLVADKVIKPSQEKGISDILKARFHKGRMNEALSTFRNVEYLSTMGNPISAITQIGDFSWSLYENGFYKTGKGFLKSLIGKGFKKEDLGIERIANEFSDPSFTAKLVDKIFKTVGLDKMDRLGKETFVNAYWDKVTKLAVKEDKKLISDLQIMFGKNSKQVLEDLKNKKITDDTKFVLFNRLADFQPISKSEMPEAYLAHPSGRIFYMLKTFTIKQFDIFRRETISDITSGNITKTIKGLKNLIYLGGLFMVANGAADEIKDWILGRTTSMSDRLIDNLIRLTGLTKFDIYKIREEGLGGRLAQKILFPTSIIDSLTLDWENWMQEKTYKTGEQKGERIKLETPQRIPIIGKMYYWWYGRGAQKEERKGQQTESAAKAKIKKESKQSGLDLSDLSLDFSGGKGGLDLSNLSLDLGIK